MRVDEMISKLKTDEVIYDIFCLISNYSTEEIKGYNYYNFIKVKLVDIIKLIKSDIIQKDDNIIKGYIDRLAGYELIYYFDNEGERIQDLDNVDSYSQIALTNIKRGTVSGISLYKEIMRIQRDKELNEELADSFESAIKDTLRPYEEKVKKSTEDLNKKMQEINDAVDNNIIKNIQIISVFAGIISILFANVMGIKEFKNMGIEGLLIINLSMMGSVFVFLAFTKLMIINEEVKITTIIYCMIILVISILSIGFVAKLI